MSDKNIMNAEFKKLSNTLFCASGDLKKTVKIVNNDKVYSFPGNGEEILMAGEKATFGLNNEHVLDENYRKAKTIKTEDFDTTFDINDIYSAAASLFGQDELHFN